MIDHKITENKSRSLERFLLVRILHIKKWGDQQTK